MGFFVALLVSLAITIVGELLRPKQKPQNAKASGLDDFSLPTAEEGRAIQVFCGKVKIDGANVTAYGDLETVALTRKVKTGLFSSETQTYGFKYFLGMQMVCGWGGDSVDVHEVRFGDKMPMHTRTEEGNGVVRFDFNDVDFFGGDEKEGGITGTLRFYRGTEDQPASSYLASMVNDTVPAYRGLAHAILEKMYLGTSAYIKPMSFVVSRYPNQLGVPGGMHKIGDDANPICFLYEIIVQQVWSVGLQASNIDDGQFKAVAETIYNEGYGMSLLYNGGSSAKDMISDILRHIDGVMFSDPETGLISIRLARADYEIGALPVYGPTDFIDGVKFSRPSWNETKNRIKATYVDRSADYTVTPISQTDLANVNQRNGEVVQDEVDFTGFSEYAPAALATARALKTLSYPLSKVGGSLSRRAWKTKPADVFVLNWPNLGVLNVVFRVVSVRYGGLNSNTVDIEAVEDVFAIEDIGYVAPPPSGWVDPLGPVQPVLRQDAAAVPFPLIPVEGATIATYATRSGGLDEGYKVTSDRGTGYAYRTTSGTFTPSALLVDAWPATAVAVETVGPAIEDVRMAAQIDGDVPADSMATSAALARVVSTAGEEWVAYRDADDHLRTVWRGVLDTPPIDHPAGAVVWFASSGYGIENDAPYDSDTSVDIKLLPYNARGSLAPEDATEMTVAASLRGSRPFPPGKIRVDGTHPLSMGTIAGPFVLSWAHRNRKYAKLVDQNANSVTPEEGTSYNIRAYRTDTDALLVSANGFAESASIALAYTGEVRIEIESKVGNLVSHKPQSFLMAYDAAGTVTSVITIDEADYILDGGGA